jgi:shikimate kinase
MAEGICHTPILPEKSLFPKPWNSLPHSPKTLFPASLFSMRNPSHLWLLGLSGSGKSTVGPLLAKRLAMPFIDTDKRIVQAAKLSIPQIFAQGGEKEFRKWESKIITQLVQSPASVIACGGGVVIDPQNRIALSRSGIRIYLQAEPPILAQRLASSFDRPLLPADQIQPKLAEQLAARKKWYEESDIQIPIGSESSEQICGRILAFLPTS